MMLGLAVGIFYSAKLVALEIVRSQPSISSERLGRFRSYERLHCKPSVSKHREIFLKFYQIKPKSDCIHHFPIDLRTTDSVCLLFQFNRKMIKTI